MAKHSRTNRRTSLRVERLEARQLLAGNVVAEFNGETLKVDGDDAANQVEVFRDLAGNLRVDGELGTTVTCKGAVVATPTSCNFGPSAVKDAQIKMNAGGDSLFVRDLTFSNDLVIETHDGNDDVRLRSLSVGNNLTAKTGKGSDIVIVTEAGSGLTVGNDLTIETEEGRDQVDFRNVTSAGKNLTVKTGQGNDAVRVLASVSAGDDAVFEGGSGFDTLTGEALISAGKEVKIKEFEVVV